jgi:hypothetical protein
MQILMEKNKTFIVLCNLTPTPLTCQLAWAFGGSLPLLQREERLEVGGGMKAIKTVSSGGKVGGAAGDICDVDAGDKHHSLLCAKILF